MFSAFEWMMAMRYLRARRQEGFVSVIAWFSLLGIAIGVATLIIVMSVMNGFRAELMDRILGLNGHVNVYAPIGEMSDYDAKAKIVAAVPGVISASPLIEGQVMATHNGQARGLVLRGIKSTDLQARQMIANNIQMGDLNNFGAEDSIIIGSQLASRLGVRVGDSVTIISPKGQPTAFGTVPRMRSFEVVATFSIGMFEYDSGFAFIPLHAAQVYFQMKDSVNNLEVFVSDANNTKGIGDDIKHALDEQARVFDWQKTNASFFNAIQVERNVMFLILTLIILVAAFNIISSLIMLVKDKGRDIAILRTMGATRGMIMRVFFLAGASIGVLGTASGFGLGLWFSLNIESIRQWIQSVTGTELFAAEIYFLSQLPAKVEPMEVLSTVLMGLGLSFLATIYPAWRAARLDPAEALRYE
ncbi:lipoprotein-releasing ABC transporter permease subunit [Magnetovibrio blakemorei]|uniref:Multidrug ABC transporter substrate-binding protein n=1 Tax=Magnetovibrio blakemorei TaxID=28181 RepID=A0A1E5Q958_9PROT|nr:lipoprotein-releasing ABC transporter permease subunit [Magnetovibrio blakemorei]OEJ68023.1 multidrug ABC transporter substrate-binding protein [Magnetovibrio blakemorei]